MIKIRSIACHIVLLCGLLPALASAGTVLDNARFTDLGSGRPVSLAGLRGKVVLVNFWATWCAPCREEVPMLNTLRQKWKPHGIEIVGVALDNKPEVQAFVAQSKTRYPVWLGDDSSMDLMAQLGNAASGLPFTVLLNRQGQKIGAWTGQLSEAGLQKALAPYL